MRTLLKLIFCAGLAAVPFCARAQTIGQALLDSEIPDGRRLGRNVAVFERPHPEYDAIGIPVGAFLVFPRVDIGPGYDSNVLGVETNKPGDAYAGFSPNVFVTSNWSRHQISASVGADLREYASQTSENEEAWHVQVDGKLNVVDDDTITAGFEARKLYNERNSGFYPIGAAAPLGYMKTGGYLRYTKEDGRVRAVASADTYLYRYDSVPALGGGRIDQSFNNQTTSRLSARVEYGLTPDTALFAQSSHVADALVQYFPTQLTTVSGSLRRTVEDSVDFNVSGFFDTQFKLRVDHELLRNCILSAYFTHENDDYRGISRTDDISTTGVSGLYKFSRYVGLNADLSYIDRTTSDRAAGPVFTEARFLVTASFQI